MFCPKCGARLPDGARYCGACGAPVVAPPQGGSGNVDAVHMSNRRRGKTPLIVVATVAVVAVIGVAVAFAVGLFCGSKVPEGTISINGLMYLQFERQGLDTYVTVGNALVNGSKVPYVRGKLVKDGSNEDGTIWRLEDASASNGGTLWDWYHIQFPEGAAEGKLAGIWKYSYGYDNPDDNSYAGSILCNFSDDGGAWYLQVMGGLDLTQKHYSYDDARALSQDGSSHNVTLVDGISWWANGNDYQWGKDGYNLDITFDSK